MVRTQWPVRLGDDSEVQPDISVVKVREDYYRTRHPRATDLQGEEIHFHRTPAEGKYATSFSTKYPGEVALGSLPGVSVDFSKLRLD